MVLRFPYQSANGILLARTGHIDRGVCQQWNGLATRPSCLSRVFGTPLRVAP